MDLIGLTERQKRLALISPGFSIPAVNTRLDAFIFGHDVRFVEYNAETPRIPRA
jgi:hypothetical protein